MARKRKQATEEVIMEINRALMKLTDKLRDSDKGETTALVIGICYHDGERYVSDAIWCGAQSSAINALRTLLVKSKEVGVYAAMKAVKWMEEHPERPERIGNITDNEKMEEE